MKISTNQFLKHLEETNQEKLADQLCKKFIETMRMLNPDHEDLTGSDWLSIMLNGYSVDVTEYGIDFIPNN